MKIPTRQLHAFALVCVALSYADGDVDSRELGALELALTDLGMSRADAGAAVAEAVQEISTHGDRTVRLMKASCRRIPASLRVVLFETAAHVVLADGVLGDSECARLAELRGMLGLSEAAAFAVVASAANTAGALKCKVTKAVLA